MSAQRLFQSLENLGRLPVALVAGGAGFIGSHLCEKLLSLKTRVICLDNLESGTKENLSRCLLDQNFSFIEQDVNKPFKEISDQIDYVFHLAGIEEDLERRELTISDLLTNSLGTKNLLDLALLKKSKFLFLSILDVYFAYLSPKSLDENFTSFYSHAEAKRYGEALVTEYYKNHSLNSRIVRVADVFGPRMNFYSKTEIARLLSSLIFNKDLEIPGEGLKTVYPTFVLDLVEGLIKAMFKSGTNGKVFNLIGQSSSVINFAYTLKKVNPELKIIYIKKKEELEIPISTEELLKTAKEIDWQKRPVDEAIKETVDYYLKETREIKEARENGVGIERQKVRKEEMILPEVKKSESSKFSRPPKISLKSKTGALLISIILIFLAIFYPLLDLFYHGFFGYYKLREIEKKKVVKNLDYTASLAKSAADNFSLAYQKIDSLTWLTTIIGRRKTQEKYGKIVLVAKDTAEAVYHFTLAGKFLSSAFGAVSGELSEHPIRKTNEARLEIKEAKERLSFVSANLKELKEKKTTNFFIFTRKINLEDYEKTLEELKRNLNDLDNLLSQAPLILGQDKRKIYLILLQNNMELRPTGGFIGSFALVTFEDGKLIDFKIEDIYTADGQLKGRVNPPDEILHYLGQPNWYMRDSNFSPDFPLSAKRAAWFLEKELGFLVDGVIGIDLSFAQKLIAAIGEIEVLDYKEKINANNLFEKAEKHSEIDFFPGSTQKKNFLTALGKTLFDKLIHPKQGDYFEITRAFIESLRERHLMFYFVDNRIQEVFSRQGFSGEIKTEPEIVKEGENYDYLMVVDSNFGANKANYFLERKIKQEINIGKEYGVFTKVTISYKNNSPTESWPGGRYKNYLRIIVPKEAIFEGADISENKKPKLISALTEDELKNLKPDEFLVIEATESGRKSWGTLIEVPVGKSREVSFNYRYPSPMNFAENIGEYYLYVQKQPGVIKDNYNLFFGYPSFLKVFKKEPKEGTEKPQVLIYNTDLLTDREFRIKFKK